MRPVLANMASENSQQGIQTFSSLRKPFLQTSINPTESGRRKHVISDRAKNLIKKMLRSDSFRNSRQLGELFHALVHEMNAW